MRRPNASASCGGAWRWPCEILPPPRSGVLAVSKVDEPAPGRSVPSGAARSRSRRFARDGQKPKRGAELFARDTGVSIDAGADRQYGRRAVMSGVRLLVGTRKGAFVLTADGKRERWDIAGPHFGGWEIYHLKGSPADPNRLYASQSSGWFGQILQRSNDGGQTWDTVGNKFVYDGVPGQHLWYDGTPHPWEFKRVWHLEPALNDPDTVYAGVEDAAMFKTSDAGQNWHELPGLRTHESAGKWAPGAGGLCLHTILIDPGNPRRMFIAIS